MALDTHSRFYFGYNVTADNQSLDFDEGGPEIQATVAVGNYTLTEFASAIQNAMNNVGGQTYTVTVDRSARTLTISAAGTFSLLVSSGSRAGSTVYTLAGFTGADRTGASSYLADSVTGQEYTTQFILQSYIPKEHSQRAASAVVNKAVSGDVEVVTFGQEKFIEMDFKFITDQTMDASSPIRNRASGIADFVTFIQFMTTKAPFEFMPDEDTVATFDKVILESTNQGSDGVAYKLKDMSKLAGYKESGPIKLRVLE